MSDWQITISLSRLLQYSTAVNVVVAAYLVTWGSPWSRCAWKSTGSTCPTRWTSTCSSHVVTSSLVLTQTLLETRWAIEAGITRPITQRTLVSGHASARARHVITGSQWVDRTLTCHLTARSVCVIGTLCIPNQHTQFHFSFNSNFCSFLLQVTDSSCVATFEWKPTRNFSTIFLSCR